MAKALIADAHPLIRRALRDLLGSVPGMSTLAEATSRQELFEHAGRHGIDFVTMEFNLKGGSGLEILQDFKCRHPKINVLVYTALSEEKFGCRSIEAGAHGYLCKDAPSEHLVEAIKNVSQGRKYASAALHEILLGNCSANHHAAPHQLLSLRELEIARLIAAGFSLKAIAARLGLKEPTVSTYRARVLDKVGLKSNAELAIYLDHQHLLPSVS